MRAILILSLTMIFFGSVVTAGTLEDVKARGKLRCVVTTGLPGFAAPDANGVWRGFDWDFCRATAAAVLGDAN
ncbi:MAG: amino acid ABC transporter substrate-binding protein, partial [SAR324 cluster bacterium]|nr:amino acid ABC transporter substrate-binding protein [SAR324 cluster bacterium]